MDAISYSALSWVSVAACVGSFGLHGFFDVRTFCAGCSGSRSFLRSCLNDGEELGMHGFDSLRRLPHHHNAYDWGDYGVWDDTHFPPLTITPHHPLPNHHHFLSFFPRHLLPNRRFFLDHTFEVFFASTDALLPLLHRRTYHFPSHH